MTINENVFNKKYIIKDGIVKFEISDTAVKKILNFTRLLHFQITQSQMINFQFLIKVTKTI